MYLLGIAAKSHKQENNKLWYVADGNSKDKTRQLIYDNHVSMGMCVLWNMSS